MLFSTSMSRRPAALLVLVASLLVSPRSHALPTAADQAAAEALYDAGRKLFQAGNYAVACPKFEESQRLDPGVGTMLFLGTCFEKTGRLASAWVTFREAAVTARSTNQPDREKKALELANAVEPRLARLQVVVPPENDLPGLAIKRDGSALGRALWGVPFPVDQGQHSIEISAPGRKTTVLAVDVPQPGQVVTARIPALDPLPAPPTSTASAASSAPAASAAPLPPPPPPVASAPPESSLRTPALVAVGVGVLGVGLGSFFGLQAIRRWHDAQGDCSGDVCRPGGYDNASAASRSGHLSTAFFAVGAVGLGTGLTLWLLSPPPPAASGQVAPSFTLGTSGATLFARASW
jgi:serine/threonine-protein kinase